MDHRRTFVPLGLAIASLLLPAGASAAQELSPRLQQLASGELKDAGPRVQGNAVSLLPDGPGSLLRLRGSLVVNIRVAGGVANRLGDVRSAGGEIIATSTPDHLIEAAVSEDELRAVADLAGVEAVTEVITPMTGAIDPGPTAASGAINACAPGVVSEGDTQLKSGAARTQFDVDATGVKVGVLSDSYDTKTTGLNASDDVTSGDLPGPGNPCGRTTPVQVADDSAGPQADEGRAMVQIVHDLAPGADLAFATAFTGQVSFANNIRDLAAAGADVITDDVIYFDEPFFQDGIIANAVTRRHQRRGRLLFDGVQQQPARERQQLLGGTVLPDHHALPGGFAAEPGADDCMDFDPTSGTDNMFDVTLRRAGPGGSP